jgi:hypothetical protein
MEPNSSTCVDMTYRYDVSVSCLSSLKRKVEDIPEEPVISSSEMLELLDFPSDIENRSTKKRKVNNNPPSLNSSFIDITNQYPF